jgi:hypothetical protein
MVGVEDPFAGTRNTPGVLSLPSIGSEPIVRRTRTKYYSSCVSFLINISMPRRVFDDHFGSHGPLKPLGGPCACIHSMKWNSLFLGVD